MSKSKSPAPPKATVEFKVGDIVLAKVKGFSAWPSVIVDAETVPRSVKSEKPKSGTYHCVRFMPIGEFGWPSSKDITLLTTEKIDSMMEKDKKKSGKMYKGLETAKSPAKWILEKEDEAQKQIELEANVEEDQLDEDLDGEKKKGKGRKAAAGSKKKKAAKDEDEPASKKSKRAPRKRKAGDDSDDDKPNKKKAKKDEEEDAALANDPEAVRIKEWRHQLQRAFLRDNVKPEASALAEYDETFLTIETYQGLTIQYLSYSKIGKVMKKISQLEDAHIPDNDGQFHFRERAGKLVTQWHAILNSKPDEKDGAATVNGTAEKTDDAPAETTAAAGDVSVMTEA